VSNQPALDKKDDANAADPKPVPPGNLADLETKWPDLFNCIDTARISQEQFKLIENISARAVDFDSIKEGGRGELYRRAQINPLIRSVGIRQLFEFVSEAQDLRNLSLNHKILDVLGGDGVLARALSHLVPPSRQPNVLTSDISEGMVAAAREYGLFAVRQAAQNLMLKENCLDGLIIAYGTHHIPPAERQQALLESFRVLRPGGRVVVHDFEVNSPISGWFSDVVDPYSLTGHRFQHFLKKEIKEFLVEAGFEDVTVRYLYDPFILSGASEREVQEKLANCLLEMYGLVKLVEEHGDKDAHREVYGRALNYFSYDYHRMRLPGSFGMSQIQTYKNRGRWYIEAPRIALVGYGVKPLSPQTRLAFSASTTRLDKSY